MATISTTADLIRLLREDPEFAAEVRRFILTEELLQLPAQFVNFVSWTQNKFQGIEADITELKDGQKRLEENQGRLEEGQKRLRNDVADIKGFMTARASYYHIRGIASQLGLFRPRRQTRDDLIDMCEDWQAAQISWDDIKSFWDADFVLKGPNAAGQPEYVAVEASYTIDNHDISRAVRNAGYITRFTNSPCRAVVVGVQLHTAARETLERSAEAACYLLPVDVLRPS